MSKSMALRHALEGSLMAVIAHGVAFFSIGWVEWAAKLLGEVFGLVVLHFLTWLR